ncbi:MAG: folylpolyglutamate synthase/dihydrofolate synthase family protein [Nitrospirota bacterium]
MSYSGIINYLYNLQKHGIKLGLENINRLMSGLGSPHKSFPSVHVAGTNGKGSTSAIVASILRSAGLNVGLFTSPHLVSFTERIKINDEQITENDVVSLTEEIKELAANFGGISPTFFEVVTSMAFLYFKRKKVDIAVIEVGMGGRLDATNVIAPEVSVITSINYDHKEFLGTTLKEIATEKAGIIKEGIPVVSAPQKTDAEDIIKTIAYKKKSPLFVCNKDFKGLLKSSNLKGISFDYYDEDIIFSDLFIPLVGEHQLINSCIAIKAAMMALKKSCKLEVEDYIDSLREGLKNVRWPGRLEIVSQNPDILIDGAHNPAAAEALSTALKNFFLGSYKRVIIIFGIMNDKDINGIMNPLLPLASEIILTSPEYARAASPEKLADVATSLGFQNIKLAPTVKDAIEMARSISLSKSMAPNSSLIIITGSFYTIGEAKEALGEKAILSNLRESL